MNSPTETTNTVSEEPMLTAIEARVLGSLMEKQLATPDAYPITLNSLVLACNQKTSREPISNYNAGEVQRCASQLQDKNLIVVDYGTRAARYDQRLTRVLGLDKGAQALLNVLLLRGPQTLAELFTRTQRMFDFESINTLEEKLEHLCAKTLPYFVRIPRAANQREDRFMHLLCGQPDVNAIAAMANSSKNLMPMDSEQTNLLEQKITSLEDQVLLLQRQVKLLMELNGVNEEDVNESKL